MLSLKALLLGHASYAWTADAQDLIKDLPISCIPASGAHGCLDGLCVPANIPFQAVRMAGDRSCFGVTMPVISPLAVEDFRGFAVVPEVPWLWRNQQGALMLSFNLAGIIRHFLEFDEERTISERDEHGRLPIHVSTVSRLGLLQEPLINKYLFAVLAVAKGRSAKLPASDPTEHVLPPALVLSHDCDLLRGNDAVTQAVRAYRTVAPLRHGRRPALRNIGHIVSNTFAPRKHYWHDAVAMLDAERQFGFKSALYFLTGAQGRYGCRSGNTIVRQFVRQVPSTCEIGIHYNYGYARSSKLLRAQISELEDLTGVRVTSGRAHYLNFDPLVSFSHLAECGISVDESLGFVQQNSFRQLFAGAFPVADGSGLQRRAVIEIPMQFMDVHTTTDLGPTAVFTMASSVERVGGLVTVLFHPGTMHNPEHPALFGRYLALLGYFHRRSYRCMLPREVGQCVVESASALIGMFT